MRLPPFHKLIICTVFIGSTACLSGQSALSATNPAAPIAAHIEPRLSFAARECNFGRVFTGMIVKHVFIATNTGHETLVISGVEPECRCTVVESRPLPMAVEPGKAAEFSIQLDTRGLEGELFKTVTVTSNERLSPIQTLSLRGVVEQPLQVSPPFLSISFPPEQSANATGTVRVINRTAHPVTLSEPTTSSGSFKATLQTLKSGQEFEVGVTGVPPFPPGNTAGIVSLKTSWTNLPVLTITVVARVQPALEADPWELVLPRQITSWTTNLVTITNNANRAVALFDPQVSDPRARVELKTIIPGRSFLLAAAFPPGFELAPGQSVQLSINSDNPSRPLLTVWVRQDSAVPAPPQVRPRIHIKPQPAGQ